MMGEKKQHVKYYLILFIFQVEAITTAWPTQTTTPRVSEENDCPQAVATKDSPWMQCVSRSIIVAFCSTPSLRLLQMIFCNITKTLINIHLSTGYFSNAVLYLFTLVMWNKTSLGITNDSRSHSSLAKHSITRLYRCCCAKLKVKSTLNYRS